MLAGVTPIDQQIFYFRQIILGIAGHNHCTITISYICRRYMNGMGQTLSINRNMTFDPRNFLPRIIAFLLRAISILHALGIYYATACLHIPTIAGADLAN